MINIGEILLYSLDKSKVYIDVIFKDETFVNIAKLTPDSARVKKMED